MGRMEIRCRNRHIAEEHRVSGSRDEDVRLDVSVCGLEVEEDTIVVGIDVAQAKASLFDQHTTTDPFFAGLLY